MHSICAVTKNHVNALRIGARFLPLVILIFMFSFGCSSRDESVTKSDNLTIDYDVSYTQNEEENVLGRYTISYSIQKDVYKVTEHSEFTVNAMSESMLVDNQKDYEYNSDSNMVSFTEIEKNNSIDMYNMRSVIQYDDIVKVSTSERRVDTEGGPGVSENIEKILPRNLDVAIHNSEIIYSYYNKANDIAVGDYWFTVDMYGYVEHYKYEKDETIFNDILGQINCKKIVRGASTFTEYWLNDDNQIVQMKQVMPNDFVVIYSLSSIA